MYDLSVSSNELLNMRRIALLLLLFSGIAAATITANPVGYWQLRDKNGNVSAIIRIYHAGNATLAAKLISYQARRDMRCTACTGALKNHPYRGLQLITGLKPDGENTWRGGRILDPETGKFSKVRIRISSHGSRLKITDYGFISWFGSSAVWTRRK